MNRSILHHHADPNNNFWEVIAPTGLKCRKTLRQSAEAEGTLGQNPEGLKKRRRLPAETQLDCLHFFSRLPIEIVAFSWDAKFWSMFGAT